MLGWLFYQTLYYSFSPLHILEKVPVIGVCRETNFLPLHQTVHSLRSYTFIPGCISGAQRRVHWMEGMTDGGENSVLHAFLKNCHLGAFSCSQSLPCLASFSSSLGELNKHHDHGRVSRGLVPVPSPSLTHRANTTSAPRMERSFTKHQAVGDGLPHLMHCYSGAETPSMKLLHSKHNS